jgi:hypothetical protein
VFLVSASAVAAEPTKAECVAANSAAQDLRTAGKLREAHVKLALCISASCPGPVREDCGERLRDLEKATPSIVFEAKDGAGNDLSAVVVIMDGQPLAKKLDGAALVVDPGEHTFTFEADRLPTVEKKLVLREGEKERRERVTLGDASAKKDGLVGPTSGNKAPSRVPTIVAFSACGVGLIVGIVFAGLWSGDPCATGSTCTEADKSAHESKLTAYSAAMAVGFVVAGAGAVTGTILLLTSSGAPTMTHPTSALQVKPTLGFGWAGIEGSF